MSFDAGCIPQSGLKLSLVFTAGTKGKPREAFSTSNSMAAACCPVCNVTCSHKAQAHYCVGLMPSDSFEVKQDGMKMEACTPLELPFVDNQVDFAFYESCDACDASAMLLPLG